jgi:hypothetical protein
MLRASLLRQLRQVDVKLDPENDETTRHDKLVGGSGEYAGCEERR